MKKSLVVLALIGLFAASVHAAGPESIAKANRSLWPDPIDSTAGYNRASRAEILVFADSLAELSDRDDAALLNTLHIKSLDRASIRRVRDRLLLRLLNNFVSARMSCSNNEAFCDSVTDIPGLIAAGRSLGERLPGQYRPWFDHAVQFHRLYARELVRLAALFTKVSSEIDTFDQAERIGFELPDGHFLLTFDDGPTTARGATDALLPVLDQYQLHGMFYVLGDRLKKRLQSNDASELQKLYDGQCVALHGWLHESHQKWDQWQTSILDTQRLVQVTWPAAYRPYFRPPYGQRRSDSESFFANNRLRVALWNIDSQDWNAKITGEEAAQRVLTLMLLWRSGVILFHDVHDKAAIAVPWIVQGTRKSGIVWEDCHEY